MRGTFVGERCSPSAPSKTSGTCRLTSCRNRSHRLGSLPGSRHGQPSLRAFGRNSYRHLFFGRKRPGTEVSAISRRMGRPDSLRRQRQCFPPVDPSIPRTTPRRICLNLFYPCIHRKISLFVTTCRREAKIRFLLSEQADYDALHVNWELSASQEANRYAMPAIHWCIW